MQRILHVLLLDISITQRGVYTRPAQIYNIRWMRDILFLSVSKFIARLSLLHL